MQSNIIMYYALSAQGQSMLHFTGVLLVGVAVVVGELRGGGEMGEWQ